MTVHTREELERSSRIARRAFSHAFMSDTKWRKLFAVLEDRELGLCQMRVKFIEGPQPRTMSLPTMGAGHAPHPYIDTFEFGPVEFRAIEWLEIPAVVRLPRPDNVPAREINQDLDRIEARLTSIGQFPIQRCGENLRVIGYSR